MQLVYCGIFAEFLSLGESIKLVNCSN